MFLIDSWLCRYPTMQSINPTFDHGSSVISELTMNLVYVFTYGCTLKKAWEFSKELRPKPGHPLRKHPSPASWYDKPLVCHINRYILSRCPVTCMISQFGNWLFTLFGVSVGSQSWLLPSDRMMSVCKCIYGKTNSGYTIITCQWNFFPPNHLRRRLGRCSLVPF